MSALPKFFTAPPSGGDTRRYVFAPARPETPAEDCTDAQLLELARDAAENTSKLLMLIGSPEHVRRLCELLVDLDAELGHCQLDLDAERNNHQVAALELECAVDRCERLQRRADQVAIDGIFLRHRMAGTTPAAVELALRQAAEDDEVTVVAECAPCAPGCSSCRPAPSRRSAL